VKLRTAAPDGITAAFLLAFVATAGIVYINIMQLPWRKRRPPVHVANLEETSSA
jgi:hypothetical protein